jgi:hypothetical protein
MPVYCQDAEEKGKLSLTGHEGRSQEETSDAVS